MAVVLHGFVQMTPILTKLHFRFVDRDLNEQRAELGFLAKPAQGFECLQHGFLSDLFGIGFVLNDRDSRKKYGALVGQPCPSSTTPISLAIGFRPS